MSFVIWFKTKSGGEKVKRNIFLLTLMILIAVFSSAPVMANACSPVEITKELYCKSAKPPYYVGEPYTWWINITVTAYSNLSSVMVYDRLGAELRIDGVSMHTESIEHNFMYDPYAWNGDVKINNVTQGKLNKDGVNFDGFHIFWTGKSVKAHFMWNVGPMIEGETKTIFVIVSTDTNPAGWQEYTSCGWYDLNSGATVKAILESTGKQSSAESESIPIYVNCTSCE